MWIKFWGTRGSIPTPISAKTLQHKIRKALEGAAGLDLTDPEVLNRYMKRLSPEIGSTVGGNTPCIEVRSGDQLLILDAGSGLRLLGQKLMAEGLPGGKSHADFLMTHTHWDHIQGFPFFTPAFIPVNTFTFYSPMADLEDRLRGQQNEKWFPVSMDYMQAKFEFIQIDPKATFKLGNFTITPIELVHHGKSYAYRIEDDSSCLVYATDGAYEVMDEVSTQKYVDFFRGADLLIFDAHFSSFEEAVDKPDWGHSTPMMGATFLYRSEIKKLALFHHNPLDDDKKIHEGRDQAQNFLARHTIKYPYQILIAEDELEIDLDS